MRTFYSPNYLTDLRSYEQVSGDQWSVGDCAGMHEAARTELSGWLSNAFALTMGSGVEIPQIPQRLREYDPEWARSFWQGSVYASCDHAQMLASVKCPVLYTHHFRNVDENQGSLMGAASDLQAERVCELVAGSGQQIDYRSFPRMAHSMHATHAKLFSQLLVEFEEKLRH